MKRLAYALLLFVAGMFIGQILTYKRMSETGVAKRDTITITRETRTTGTEVNFDVARYTLPVICYVKAEPETIRVPRDTILTREQKEYRDSTYDAWVSGIDARLDSIRTYARNVTIRDTITRYEERTITNTILKKESGWKVTFGAGLCITPKGVEPGFMFGVVRIF